VPPDTLTTRRLNRSLLARQGLLERSRVPALEMVERLVGMQAQVPENPYVALWSRIEDFDPSELSDLIAERRAVPAHVMRSTIHLLSARDCLAIHPLTQDVLIRAFGKPRREGFGALTQDYLYAGDDPINFIDPSGLRDNAPPPPINLQPYCTPFAQKYIPGRAQWCAKSYASLYGGAPALKNGSNYAPSKY
jgi:Winged helix DNA-binding domain